MGSQDEANRFHDVVLFSSQYEKVNAIELHRRHDRVSINAVTN